MLLKSVSPTQQNRLHRLPNEVQIVFKTLLIFIELFDLFFDEFDHGFDSWFKLGMLLTDALLLTETGWHVD